MIQLVGITQENFSKYWPEIKPLLEEACQRSEGQIDPNDAVRKLAEGYWFFWVGIDDEGKVRAFAVTEVLEFHAGALVANILITTGTGRNSWKHLIGDLEDWARDQGCETLQTWARKGWARELPGYKVTHVLLTRRL